MVISPFITPTSVAFFFFSSPMSLQVVRVEFAIFEHLCCNS